MRLGVITASHWRVMIRRLFRPSHNESMSAPALASIADLVPAVLRIGFMASAAIMRVYDSEFAVEHKADDSPLTLADREAHHLITTSLHALTPEIPVLSEESSAEQHAFATRSRWSRLWLVDPLDGTREFVNRNGEFTVNIALVIDQRPMLGVVFVPATQEAYVGMPGSGAQRIRQVDAQLHSQPIRTRRAPKVPVVLGSRSHRGDSLADMLVRLGPHELVGAGSALKFCRIAEGVADFYPRLGPTSEWDTAAGQALVEAAGGQVLGLDGKPLRYNARDTLLNPHFIAIGDRDFAWQPLLGTPLEKS